MRRLRRFQSEKFDHLGPEALRAKAAELERAESWARQIGLESFHRFVERFGANKAVQPR
jgi:hypothetical protein